jgi:hypothetical protein
MKPENKAALTVGAQTALVTAAAAILLAYSLFPGELL